jgi:multicomponent Na+:H+ antiporter subunit D
MTDSLASVTFILFLFGFATAGIMPMHAWLPGAMVAPTPVSSLLHAVAVVKVGVFSIIRVVTCIYGVDYFHTLQLGGVSFQGIVCCVAAFTVVASSLIALSQDGLKRRLAFSTVGQLGYIVLGVLLLTPAAVTGSLVHIVMHAFGKITLFFCAGAIYVAHGKKYISQMHGLGRIMPVTFFAFLIGSMSVVGLPPAGGFVSKWFLVTGAYQNGDLLFLVAYLLSSFLGAAYLLSIPFDAFFKPAPADEDTSEMKEAPLPCLIAILTTACITIVVFFYPDIFFELASQPFK